MKILSSSVRLWAVLLTIGLFFVPITTSPKIVQSQDRAPVQIIESDDPRVLQVGNWSSQTAAPASNSTYLFSSGAEADVLGLSFLGSAIEIIYVSGPQFGTLAIEIDGIVVRTVITTAEKIEYGQVAKVDYLADEPHSLKIYAQEGDTIAVDAFRISPSLNLEREPGGEVNVFDDGGIQSSVCAPVNNLHRVSVGASGQQNAQPSNRASLSYDGRYVSFETEAALVLGDDNFEYDIYLYDRQTCALELASVSTLSRQGTLFSFQGVLSADARYVVFESLADNLIPGDTNLSYDVIVRDRQTGTTSRVSVASGGAQGNGSSTDAAVSSDGRYVAFESAATNLVAGDTNAQADIFVHDRQLNTTNRVSIVTGGAQASGGDSLDPSISADGRYVAFSSSATNLITGDTNNLQDIFIHDRQTSTTTRLSVATGGTQASGGHSGESDLSADGRYVTFASGATNLVTGDTNAQIDIFVHDRQTGTTTRVSVATGGAQGSGGGSSAPDISADGRYVTFASSLTNLVAGDTNGVGDVFLHDRQTSTTSRLSVNTGGVSPNNASGTPAISGDGRYVAFLSDASDLIAGDTNGVADIFATARAQPSSDNLALFQANYKGVLLLDTLADNPPANSFTFFSSYAPVSGGQWIMGDWNADGLKTPGVYLNGAFHYTNDAHETKKWQSLWIGVNGPVVAGSFETNADCVGVVDSANFPPFGTAFVLYMVCDLSGNPTPPIFAEQWLSVLLPTSGGFSGTHQFVMGDWDGDGVDTIACRRGAYITWTNDSPFTASAGFANAQYFGAPGVGSEGQLVDGDWDRNGTDSFGLFYQNGEFFYRNDLTFNSGAYVNQSVGTPFGGTGVQATTWR